MGRASKSHTSEEKRLQRKATSKAYSAAHRSQISERKRRSYLKLHSRKGTPYINKAAAVQSLPPTLIALAAQPLPTSKLFLEASQSADNLDESEIAGFDGDPPYVIAQPSPNDAAYIEKMVDVMSGRRARHERDTTTETDSMSSQCIERALIDELRDWTALATFLQSYEADPCHTAMARNRLWWRARTVNNLFVAALEVRGGRSKE
ncbi:hypothetical protein EYR38_001669 [Pleurotus pulmonarius]|nr:hypothetical protein EYR38_003499 [Pleurotus pulmonarius]KAF4607597.1 hypothetical protein EYR38_001669 [Pleurotus pulmonarius]